MTDFPPDQLTRILNTLKDGDQNSSDELLQILYHELRSLARSLMAKVPPGNTLQPTALVHEAYLRLQQGLDSEWDSRGHFFASAAQAMRFILVEQARRKATDKHGGDLKRVDLDTEIIPFNTGTVDILALDRALEKLQEIDERKVNVVLLRFLTGLTIPETAQALHVSEPTVERDWSFARAFLFDHMNAPASFFESGSHES